MNFQSVSKVNSLFYLSMLKSNESYIIQDTIRDLRPFFDSVGLPFSHSNIDDKSHLESTLSGIATAAEAGLFPLVHIVAHGAQGGGVAISDTDEMMYWDELASHLKKINNACGNNLIVIASVCFGFEMLTDLRITTSAPFYALIAPEKTLRFTTFVSTTTPFYKLIFSGKELFQAHETILSTEMSIFHSEQMFANVFARYIINCCRGEGRRRRISHLVELAIKEAKFPDNAVNRDFLARTAESHVGPTQEQFDRYATMFLMGKPTDLKLTDILAMIDQKK